MTLPKNHSSLNIYIFNLLAHYYYSIINSKTVTYTIIFIYFTIYLIYLNLFSGVDYDQNAF